MQDGAVKQIKSSEVQNRITGNLELAQLLSKTAQEIEDKILGTQTPWDTPEGAKNPSPGGFIPTAVIELDRLHAELLHLKDILHSISKEF